MKHPKISLKSIDKLRINTETNLPQQFFIPAYQRGYRWSTLQVTQLLEDIREFTQRKNPQPDEFYCLQPLVIKVREENEYEYEVVDGQQRLTTLLLILRHFNERLTEKYQLKLYQLAYETREALDAFLENPVEEEAEANPDFFHIYQAMQVIEDWFSERENEVDDIKTTFLNKVKVIWFQLGEGENPVAAFTRLNVGKIPLTNDELIRALFLRRIKNEENHSITQLRIAYEWDLLEKALQSDAFWYFISNRVAPKQNRIGFLFELVANEDEMPYVVAQDAYGVFHTFNERLKKQDASIADEWLRIKATHLQLEEWFEDRTLFHMVGFLVNEGMTINDIRFLAKDCPKSSFEQALRKKIFRKVLLSNPPETFNARDIIRDMLSVRAELLTYSTTNHDIRSWLLLFNLATALSDERSNLRFQFDNFKCQRWDIEHIRSVTNDKPGRNDQQREWLGHCKEYFESQEMQKDLVKEIDTYLILPSIPPNPEAFDKIYEELLKVFNEESFWEAQHGVANLTLLDESTNRSYGNSVFAIKRQKLLELDQAGIFVPLCTRNVFLKCYSPQVGNAMFWSEKDRDGYEVAMIDTLTDFFCGFAGGSYETR
ncbi:DUF262 domain-containing protein [Shewanella sp. HL-SH4]|uniref:DUF262 domain-containing protein n=1 Tax=Shewanella sp. HL-SH4 TaxID=3436240 RepID=UPI003EB935CD